MRARAFPSSASEGAEEGSPAAATAGEGAASDGKDKDKDGNENENENEANVLQWASRSTWRNKRRGDAEVEDEEGINGGDDHGFDPHCPCCLTTVRDKS